MIEDNTLNASGHLTVNSGKGTSSIQPQNDVPGTFGSFSISADGNWTYTLANDFFCSSGACRRSDGNR